MKQFSFKRTPKGYEVSGKKTPCSSKAKVIEYIKREFYRYSVNATKGRITIEVDTEDEV